MPNEIMSDLQGRYRSCWMHGTFNYVLTYVFLVIAIAASAAATVSILMEIFPKQITAGLSAIPGIAYLINKQFKFEERAKWWFQKFHMIEGLYRGIKYEGRTPSEVSKELTESAIKHLSKWPGFGMK